MRQLYRLFGAHFRPSRTERDAITACVCKYIHCDMRGVTLRGQMRAHVVDVSKLEPIRPINLAPPETRAVEFAAREKLQSSDWTISAIAATVRAHRVRI